jgi:hypothetical protein
MKDRPATNAAARRNSERVEDMESPVERCAGRIPASARGAGAPAMDSPRRR